MEANSVQNVALPIQGIIDAAMNNRLVVSSICSALSSSVADLLSLRLLSHCFHRETKTWLRLALKLHFVDLSSDQLLDKFLKLMKTRLRPEERHSFPFSAFTLNLPDSSEEMIERFAAEVGQHVRGLKFRHDKYTEGYDVQSELVILLISRTPHYLVQIDLTTWTPVHLQNCDLHVFPLSYSRLAVIGVDVDILGTDNTRCPPDSVPLLSFLMARAPLRPSYVPSFRISMTLEDNPGLLNQLRTAAERSLRLPVHIVTGTPYHRSNLAYVLRHFPRVTGLSWDFLPPQNNDLDIVHWDGDLDYWNVLTGESPKPSSTSDLLHGMIDGNKSELEEPVDGVRGVSSLRNLKSLKWLQLRPLARVNLDAIVYMTRVGSLVPLDSLEIRYVEEDFQFKAEEKNIYLEILANVHSAVSWL